MNVDDKTRWRLMRQDDNGNVFMIEVFTDENHARSKGKELEAKGHKQTYWVEEHKES